MAARDRRGGRTAMTRTPVTDFLVSAAREFRRSGGHVFIGFHWPVLAAHLAHELTGKSFVGAYEAGALCWGPAAAVPTSTSDFPAYAETIAFRSDSLDLLTAGARRFDMVVLDAGTIDLYGRVNSSFVGDRDAPRVRLPGGGGAPDVAAKASDLLWLHGGLDPSRLVESLDTVTAAPGPNTSVRLLTVWGLLHLGPEPRLLTRTDAPLAKEFRLRLRQFGIDDSGAADEIVSGHERTAATRVLAAAADKGYVAARRIAAEWQGGQEL
jgi:glutaconate CoA-transferase subunit B